ncbi:MAG: hypothetical protein QXJ17_06690 [Nitrososphaeria archaeon]
MSTEQQRIISRCDKWRSNLVHYLTRKPNRANIEKICHSVTYLLSWMENLSEYDQESYDRYLQNIKFYLNKASESIFNYFYTNCRNNSKKGVYNSARYVKSVGELIDHLYYVLWCSYYGENDSFIEEVYNTLLNDIARNLPPTSSLRGREGKRVGKKMWDILVYFEKLLDHDVPTWAIQKFQTKDLIKPKVKEDETFNIMSVLDEIELTDNRITDDLQYRQLRNNLLKSTEYGSKERRRALNYLLKQRCKCGAQLKLGTADVEYDRDGDRLILVTRALCEVCHSTYSIKRAVEKTKDEFEALDQLDEYLRDNYGISLVRRIRTTFQN